MTEVRDRLTERITGDRLKLEAKRSGPNVVILVLGLAVAFAGAAYIFSNVAPTLVAKSRPVAFEVDSARAVRPGLNEIRIKGVPVGRVTGVELKDGKAIVKAEVKNGFGKVYRDARAELRPNSALEDQFLDVVDRGHPAAGELTADKPLGRTQTTIPVGVDDVLNTFNGDTRARLRVLLAELGQGLDDNGDQLRQAFVDVAPLLQSAGTLTKQLAVRKPMTERLIHNVGVLTGELGQRDEELRGLVHNGALTTTALQEGRGDLDQTLALLPPTLSRIDSSFAATRNVLGDVDGALRSLGPVADRLPSSLKAVSGLSDDLKPALEKLQTPVQKLVPLTGTLPKLSQNLSTVVSKLRPQVDTVDRTTTNLVKCEVGINGFFQWDASISKFGDLRGQAPRGNLVVGGQSAGLPSPFEKAYQGCAAGGPIGGRAPDQSRDGQ